jgi:antitoxin ParD1/3/4
MKVSLGKSWDGFVDEAISGGRFSSADAVVEAGLQLLKRHEDERRALRARLDAAIAAGGEVSDAELDTVLAADAAELRRSGLAD